MKIVSRFLNKSEEIVFRELAVVANDNALRVFAKPRLSDVLEKSENEGLTRRVFDYYARAHFDFLITKPDLKPFIAVEYDGPRHAEAIQIERDEIKAGLCRSAAFPLLRINANHVTRKFRGMTLLRWIVEVSQLEEAFYEAQTNGQVPWDEPFDPAFFDSIGEGKRFPYWLSARETIRIHDFLKSWTGPKGWHGYSGYDEKENVHRLEYVQFGDQVLYAKTAVRHQDASFPIYDLANEIGICELGEQIRLFLEKRVTPLSVSDFSKIHARFHKMFKTGSSHGMGIGIPHEFKFQ